MRPTIRVRLTLLYGALFLLAGLLVLAATYLLVGRSLRLATPGLTVVGGGKDIVAAGTGEVLDVGQLNELIRTKQEALHTLTMHSLLTDSTVILAVVAVLALGLGYLLAGRALRPLARISSTAGRIAERNLHERITVPTPRDEVHELARSFNAMLARLDRAFGAQRRFAANASHELRTPLAINRTLLELAVEEPDCPAETRRLATTLMSVNVRQERLIEGLLTLASSDREITDRTRVDLGDLVRDTLAHCAAEIGSAAVSPRTTLAAATTDGDAVLLERLVHNLVVNAIRHNRPGGWVDIRTGTAAGEAEIRVTNTGPVVVPDELPRLFQPFQRGDHHDDNGADDNDTRGAGLGLSIVDSITRAHRGTVAAEPRAGGGLSITVTLPAANLKGDT